MNLKQLGWDSFFDRHFKEFHEPGFIPARIAVEQKNLYTVYTELGEYQARISGKFRFNATVRSDYPAVGDWVAVSLDDSRTSGVIHALLPRKSSFSRKLPVSGGRKLKQFQGETILDGGSTEGQVIAANVDYACIVTGLDQNFNVSRIERYLTVAYNSGASPVIVLNKKDLCPNVEECCADVETVAFGLPVHPISAVEKDGLEIFDEYLVEGKTVAFLGSSGVGKSTIINKLLGEERQKVIPTSESIGKGRHTTTYRELIVHPLGGIVMDTPGMRELQIWGDEEDLGKNYSDIEDLFTQCRFRNCRHKSEPGCAVQKALSEGLLDRDRYRRYLKQKRELEFLAMKKVQKASLIEKAKWKRIMGK